MKDVPKTIGTIFYEARTSKGISIADMAYSIGVSQNAIRSWEANEKSPSMTNVQKMCIALQIKIQINEEGEIQRV